MSSSMIRKTTRCWTTWSPPDLATRRAFRHGRHTLSPLFGGGHERAGIVEALGPGVNAHLPLRPLPLVRQRHAEPLRLIRYRNEDDAIRIASDSAYGLAAAVFAADREHGYAIVRRINATRIVPDVISSFL
jgi:Aldehyde dehydrogenase family